MKVVLLIWYSNKNFGFRKIESYLASKIDFEIWKCPIFARSTSHCLTRYEQILSGCSLGCKNALNFTCLPMKFHNCVHTTTHARRDRREIRYTYLDKSFHCKYQFSDVWKAKYSFYAGSCSNNLPPIWPISGIYCIHPFSSRLLMKQKESCCVTFFRPHWFFQALSFPCSS